LKTANWQKKRKIQKILECTQSNKNNNS